MKLFFNLAGAISFTGIQDNTGLFHDFCRLLSLDGKKK